MDRPVERFGQGFGPLQRPVDQSYRRHPGIEQRHDHGARGTARAQHHRRARGGPPGGCRGAQVFEKAVAVGVLAIEAAVVAPDHRVDCTDPARHRARFVDRLKCRLLVRDGHVDPGKAQLAQNAERLAEMLGRRGQGQIGAVDAVAFEPAAVQTRRERMADRPAHDPGKARGSRRGHDGSAPCARRKSRSGSNGKPRMVKKSPSIRSNS